MTVIIRKVGPTLFLGSLVISWGAILVVSLLNLLNLRRSRRPDNYFKGMGFVNNWKQMVAIRVLLGALEAGESDLMLILGLPRLTFAGYFPGCVYLLSSWYVRCK